VSSFGPDAFGCALGRFRDLRRLEQAIPATAVSVDGRSSVRFGARVSEEGGSDVPTEWARGDS
jgi:hypothetical protein